MKITIIHPYSKTFVDADSTKIPVQELDAVDNASCTEVNLGDTLDYVPYNQRSILLKKACDKLRINGIITFSGSNISSICNAYTNGWISIDQYNASMLSGRLSISQCDQEIKKLESFNLYLVKALIDNLYYSIKAKRLNNEKEE